MRKERRGKAVCHRFRLKGSTIARVHVPIDKFTRLMQLIGGNGEKGREIEVERTEVLAVECDELRPARLQIVTHETGEIGFHLPRLRVLGTDAVEHLLFDEGKVVAVRLVRAD